MRDRAASRTTLAESVIGLYKAECVRPDGPFRTVNELELQSTLSWVHWWNEQRPALGRIPRSSTKRTTAGRTPPDSNRCRDNSPRTNVGSVHKRVPDPVMDRPQAKSFDSGQTIPA